MPNENRLSNVSAKLTNPTSGHRFQPRSMRLPTPPQQQSASQHVTHEKNLSQVCQNPGHSASS